MSRICLSCGFTVPPESGDVCPNCGGFVGESQYRELPPYSGTVAVSGSSCMVHDALEYIRSYLDSISEIDTEKEELMEPIIQQLNVVEELTKKQDEIISDKTGDIDEYKKVLESYKELVNNDEEEPVFQDFFTKNPSLLDSQVKKSYPKFNLGGEYEPDFLFILHDSTHLFVEIEKPTKKLFTKDGRQTSAFSQGMKQIRDYLKWARDNLEFLRRRECPRISNDNIRGLLIIGKKSNLIRDEIERLENINAEVSGRFLIKTFDQIYDDNISMLQNIEKF